jgi:hypothetical protein
MPIQYGSYSLSNSKQVKPFAGSVLPELTSVANTLQERYDTALNQEDLLGRALGVAQAAPFTQDQKLLSDLKGEYRTRIKDRSKRGDYENMMRDTMLDAKSFVDRYQPIADNAKKLEDYKTSLQQSVAKGDIKSPDKARKLLELSKQSYPGLSYDPVTGQYANHFQGLTAVKDIDPTEKVDKWMKDVAPTVLGTKTRYTDGVWMQEKEGKWTTLTPKEINQVITAGRRLDPEFNAWMDQEKQLAGVDYSGVTAESVKNMPDGPIKQAVMTSMAQGSSPARAIGQIAGASREQDVYHNMQQYANKYIRNDQETASGPTGANPFYLEDYKKQKELGPAFPMPILQPEAKAEIKGAEDLRDKIGQATTGVQTVRKNFDDWTHQEQLRPNAQGQWVDAEGNNRTQDYLDHKTTYEQAQRGLQNLRRLEAEARRRTGYNPERNITPKLMQDADTYAAKQVERSAGLLSESSGGFKSMSKEERATAHQQYKSQYLTENSPGYGPYNQVLQDITKRGAQIVNALQFRDPKATEAATSRFKDLVLNLDANGLKSGTQGLKWASGDAVGDDLESEDFKKVVANARFAGIVKDTDGRVMSLYNVGDVKQNAKGKLVGEQALVKMPASPEMVDWLAKEGQVDLSELAIGQNIDNIMTQPYGAGFIPVGKTQIGINRIDKNQLETGQKVQSGIEVVIPTKGGKTDTRNFPSVDAASQFIKNLIILNQKQNK